MADVKVEVSGLDLTGFITSLVEGAKTISGPLETEAEAIRTRSMEKVPVDTGRLKNSALEVGITAEPTDAGVIVTFGYDTEYAVARHELPPGESSDGGAGWKFLEHPFYEAAEGMEQRLGELLGPEIENLGRDAAR